MKLKIKSFVNNENILDYVDEDIHNKFVSDREARKPGCGISAGMTFFGVITIGMSLMTLQMGLMPNSKINLDTSQNIFFIFSRFQIIPVIILMIIMLFITSKAESLRIVNEPLSNLYLNIALMIILICMYYFIVLPFSITILFYVMKPTTNEKIIYAIAFFGLFINIYFSIYYYLNGKKMFLNITDETKVSKNIKKLSQKIMPYMIIIASISYTTSIFWKGIKSEITMALLPLILFLAVFLAYFIYYQMFQYLYYCYIVYEFPESFRIIQGNTNEEFYGIYFKRSKHVLKKIKEYEEYLKKNEEKKNE